MRSPVRRPHALGLIPLLLALGGFHNTAWAQRVSPHFENLLTRHSDGSASLGLGESRGIIDGMSSGDTTAPYAVIKAGGLFFPQLSRVVVDRMSGDVGRAITDAAQLRDTLRDANFPYDVETLMYYADVISAGNKILQGDLVGWIRAMDKVRTHYVAPVRAAFNLPALRFTDLRVFEPSIDVAAIPAQSADMAPENRVAFTTPSRFAGQPGVYPFLNGTLDGAPVTFQMTTGTFFGTMPLSVFNAGQYRVIGKTDSFTDSMGRKAAARYVMADTITLGESTFHNVIFKVTRSDFLSLGMSFLRQLPHVTLSRNALSFGSAAPYRCTTPIHLSMDMDGTNLNLVFPLVSAHATQWGHFASGLSGGTAFFTTVPHFSSAELKQSDLTSGDTSYGLGFFKAVQIPVEASLYGVRLHDKVQKILAPQLTSKSDLSLTANLLLYGNVSYDFASRTACFTAGKVSHAALHDRSARNFLNHAPRRNHPVGWQKEA